MLDDGSQVKRHLQSAPQASNRGSLGVLSPTSTVAVPSSCLTLAAVLRALLATERAP